MKQPLLFFSIDSIPNFERKKKLFSSINEHRLIYTSPHGRNKSDNHRKARKGKKVSRRWADNRARRKERRARGSQVSRFEDNLWKRFEGAWWGVESRIATTTCTGIEKRGRASLWKRFMILLRLIQPAKSGGNDLSSKRNGNTGRMKCPLIRGQYAAP